MNNKELQKIMVVNAGSSSLKFQLLEMEKDEKSEYSKVLIEGLFERIGIDNPMLRMKIPNAEGEMVSEVHELTIKTHADAVEVLMNVLVNKKIINSLHELSGIGHRIVHGGVNFTESVEITSEVMTELESVVDLAPLHNRAHLMGIKGFKKALPEVFQTVVFDTSFHQTMPDEAFMYAVPLHWYTDYKVRKYGFHGTSHKYVSQEAAKFLGRPVEELRLITAHIGNGGSLAAVKYGKCVDTSMGFTPLDGIVMGSRSGTIDPAVLDYVSMKEGKNVHELVEILNKQSGYFGLTGKSDARDVHQMQREGNYYADLVLRMQEKKIADYIGSYYCYMGGCDAIVFTAGIGEKSPETRAAVCHRLEEALGIKIDLEKNKIKGELMELSLPESKIKVLVVPTNEELMIARDTVRLKNEKENRQ